MSYRSYRHPIYNAVASGGCNGGVSDAELYSLYNNMYQLLTRTEGLLGTGNTTVDALTPVQQLFVASVPGTLQGSPVVYVRLVWLEQNPGIVFNRTNKVHVLQIKAIYDQIPGTSWQNDPLAPLIAAALTLPPLI